MRGLGFRLGGCFFFPSPQPVDHTFGTSGPKKEVEKAGLGTDLHPYIYIYKSISPNLPLGVIFLWPDEGSDPLLVAQAEILLPQEVCHLSGFARGWRLHGSGVPSPNGPRDA